MMDIPVEDSKETFAKNFKMLKESPCAHGVDHALRLYSTSHSDPKYCYNPSYDIVANMVFGQFLCSVVLTSPYTPDTESMIDSGRYPFSYVKLHSLLVLEESFDHNEIDQIVTLHVNHHLAPNSFRTRFNLHTTTKIPAKSHTQFFFIDPSEYVVINRICSNGNSNMNLKGSPATYFETLSRLSNVKSLIPNHSSKYQNVDLSLDYLIKESLQSV